LRKLWVLGHTVGISCLGGAVFLQCLVFSDIFQHGYFSAVEGNPGILSLEMVLTVVTVFYYVIFIWRKFLNSVTESKSS